MYYFNTRINTYNLKQYVSGWDGCEHHVRYYWQYYTFANVVNYYFAEISSTKWYIEFT